MPLVAHYPFHEDAGTTAYDVAGGNDGTVTGATVGATGILGNTAHSFDGTDDYIDVADSASLDLSSAWTVGVWMNPSDLTGYEMVVCKRSGSNADRNYFLQVTDADNTRIGFNDSGGTLHTTVSTSTVSIGAWAYIVGTWDGTNLTIYVNGVEENSTAPAGVPVTNAGTLRMGRDGGGGAYFGGDIADMRIYDHALTAGEVQYLYETTQQAAYTTNWRTL